MQGYFCNACNKDHQLHSTIGQNHLAQQQKFNEEADKRADEERKSKRVPTREEADAKLHKAIFGY